MNRCRSSGRGGVARDVELELCRLAGMVFLGTIIVIDGLKSEKKKNAQKKKQETKGCTKNCLEGTNYTST